jgi:guanine deaminase
MTERLILGQVLHLAEDPAVTGHGAIGHDSHGALRLKDGLIAETGPADALRAAHPALPVDDFGEHLILPGFIDAHAHYPQTAIIASWGKRLIDWLNTYTFPEEMRFSDPDYAAAIAERYLDLLLANGTTTVCSYCTIHPQSVDALFTAAAARGMRVLAGKTCMDRDTAPEGLRDTAQSAYDDSKALLSRWHGRGRLSYVITPRFSPTSTEAQLDALGALWAEHPDCLMQTHLSEQTDEIAWVKSLYPQARDYLDTYEAHGLLGPNGLYGHAIHLEPREIDRLAEVGAALVHCPTSNTFIGSGLFDMGLQGEDARGARHRHRRRVVLLDAAHHGRGLRDRATEGHRAASRRASVARHRRLGPRAGAGDDDRPHRAGLRGRPDHPRPRLHARHRPGPCAGGGYLAGAVPYHHDGR